MDFLHRNPFVRLFFPLVLGIMAGTCFAFPPWWIFALLFGLSLVGLVLHIVALHRSIFFRYRWLYGCAVFLFLAGCGWWLTAQAYSATQIDFAGQKNTFRVELLDQPEEKANSILCEVAVRQRFDSLGFRPAKGRVLLYLAKDTAALALQRGDELLVNTTFSVPLGNGNPESFDYVAYLQRKGIAATGYAASDYWQYVGYNPKFSLLGTAQTCQQYLLSVYRRYGICEPEFGVLAALTLGYKESLEPELQASYAASGAMHILAVSGLHVGIIFVILGFLLSFLNRIPHGTPIKAVLIVLFLWTYAFITGLSPSVLRATLMFSFVCVGQSLSRRSQIYNTIALSAFILLVYNPLLLYSVGFQLSYSAVVAIIYFQPKLNKLIYFHTRPMRWLWELLSVSVAAQLGTAPWALFYFHQFSNHFLLTNIFAIPMASVIIYTAVLLLILSPLSLVASWVALLLNGEVWLLNRGVVGIEQLPFSVSEIWISAPQMILLFACIMLAAIFIERKKAVWLTAGLTCLIAFFGINLFRHYQSLTSERLIVYADRKADVVQYCGGQTNWILTDNVKKAEMLTHNFQLRERLPQPIVNLSDTAHCRVFRIHNENYLLINNDMLYRKNIAQPVHTDHLLLGNIGKTRPEEILAIIQPRRLIALAGLQTWKRIELRRLCAESGIEFYDLAEQGALMETWKP